MAAGSTYTPIATSTLSSSSASVDFNSVSGSYTDLVLVINAAASAAVNLWVQVGNGSVDTGTNYSVTRLSGNGSSASSDRKTSATKFEMTAQSYIDTVMNFNSIIQFQNYSNTTTYKTILSRENLAAGGVDAVVGLWRSTSAINTIKVLTSSGTFSSGSTFTLYGITAA